MFDPVPVTDDIEDVCLVELCPDFLRKLLPRCPSVRCGRGKAGPSVYFEEVGGNLPRHLSIQLCMNELGSPAHSDKRVGLAFSSPDLADADMQVALSDST